MNELIKSIKPLLPEVEKKMIAFGLNPETVKSETSFALQILNEPKNVYLRKSTTDSILKSVLNISQVGLTLNPVAKEAFLIPRWDKTSQKVQCVLEPSYVGLVKLLTDAGSVTSINTQLVYKEDDFEINLASDNPVRHIPDLTERKTIMGVYSIARLLTGEKQVEWMEISEVNKIRDTSDSYKAWKEDNSKHSIWNSSYGEMCRKTVLKRIYKYLPRTNKMKFVDNAVALTNKDWEASSSQVHYAESLIHSSTIIESKKEELLRELSICNSDQIELMIDYLKDNQPDPIEAGNSYNQRDIDKKLNQHV